MKVTRCFALAGCALLCLATFSAVAGDMYPVTLRGTVFQVNGSGAIGGTSTTHAGILQNAASASGIPAANLALVYHVGGNPAFGDTLDIVDRRDGRVLETFLGFYFGEAFQRRPLNSADGRDQRRLDYVYTRQAGVAMGSAVVSKRQAAVSGGGTRLVVSGSMQWVVMPENGNAGQINTASFSTTGNKLNF